MTEMTTSRFNKSILRKVPLKFTLPIAILLGFGFVAGMIMMNPSEAKKHQGKQGPEMSVKVLPVVLTEFQVEVTAFGVVRPRTSSTLAAQVSGMVTEVSKRFQEGAFFEAGDVLLKIESRDYESAVIIAESDYVQANYQLSEEQARGKQAMTNWQRLGKVKQQSASASDLVLRKPQLAAAQANAASAKARLEQAKLDLERTKLRAPYAGRVLNRSVDRGQVITANAPVADIYAVDYLEVRLPLSGRQREYVSIPEQYRYHKKTVAPGKVNSRLEKSKLDKSKLEESHDSRPDTLVTLEASVGRNHYQWTGKITRAEGALDATSRQLNVIVQVDNPYDQREDDAPPLKIGQFIKAKVKGRRLENVFVLSPGAVIEDQFVFVVEDERLMRRRVDIIWSDDDRVVVSSFNSAESSQEIAATSLKVGDLLVVSPIGNATVGTPVAISNDQ